MTMSVPEPTREWYRQPMVWLIIAIPLAAVVMGVTTIILAVVSDDGMVTDDYYRRGLEINRSLERDRAAVVYGLNADVEFDPDERVVEVRLRAESAFRFPDRMQLSLSHSTRSGLDRSLTLARAAAQTYQARLPELAMGRWYLQLHAEAWRLNGVLKMPGQNRVILGNDPDLRGEGSAGG
jgi:hypothetical protein